MTNDTTAARDAVYILDPVSPFAIDLHANDGRGAVLRASRAFRIGAMSYCADYPHRIAPAGRGLSIVEGLGLKKGTVSVSWR
jgi:hypothetical protein